MISCLVLERSSRWRIVGIVALLAIAVVPSAPLLIAAVMEGDAIVEVLTPPFTRSIANSFFIAVLVGSLSLSVGLPLGVLSALYSIRGRQLLLTLLALPLLLPSFLPAIGWSALAARLPASIREALHGIAGCVLAFCASGVPLVLLTSVAACSTLTASQVQAARLAGGEQTLVRYAVHFASVPSLLAAALVGILSVSDPGPGQILGVHSAGSEILTSLAAQYDFALAGQQSLILALLVLLIIVPMLYWATPRLAAGLLARQTQSMRPLHDRMIGSFTSAALLLASVIFVALPLAGLLWPLAAGVELARALSELRRTGANTLVYSVLAGALATLFALSLAIFVGRNRRHISVAVAVLAAVFVLPPALNALGIVRLRTASPTWTDPLLASRFTVGAIQAIRFAPAAAVLMIRFWVSTSPSWTQAAAIHGIPLVKYLSRVMIPFMVPAFAASVLLVGLLAAGDIVTLLLLHPPGEDTLPMAIFTVMANAPESLVATLCLIQLLVAVVVLIGVMCLAGVRRA